MYLNSSRRRHQNQQIDADKYLLEQTFQKAMNKLDPKPKQSIRPFATKRYSIIPTYNEPSYFQAYHNDNDTTPRNDNFRPQNRNLFDRDQINPLNSNLTRANEPNDSIRRNTYRSNNSYRPQTVQPNLSHESPLSQSKTSSRNQRNSVYPNLYSPTKSNDFEFSAQDSPSSFSPKRNESQDSSFLYQSPQRNKSQHISSVYQSPQRERNETSIHESFTNLSPQKNSPSQQFTVSKEEIQKNRELFWQRVLQRREKEALLKKQKEQEYGESPSSLAISEENPIETPKPEPLSNQNSQKPLSSIQNQQSRTTPNEFSPSSINQNSQKALPSIQNQDLQPTPNHNSQTASSSIKSNLMTNEYSQKPFSALQDESLRTTPIAQNQNSPIAFSNQQKNERTKLLDQYERSLHDNNRNTASKDAEKILAEFQQRVMQMTQQSLNKQVQPDYNEYDDKDSLSEGISDPFHNENDIDSDLNKDSNLNFNQDEIDIDIDLDINDNDIANDLNQLKRIQQENEEDLNFDDNDNISNEESSGSFVREEPARILPSEFSEMMESVFSKEFFIKSKLEFMIEHTIKLADKFLLDVMKNVLYSE